MIRCPSFGLSVCLSVCLSVSQSFSVCLSVCIRCSVCLSSSLFGCVSVGLSFRFTLRVRFRDSESKRKRWTVSLAVKFAVRLAFIQCCQISMTKSQRDDNGNCQTLHIRLGFLVTTKRVCTKALVRPSIGPSVCLSVGKHFIFGPLGATYVMYTLYTALFRCVLAVQYK